MADNNNVRYFLQGDGGRLVWDPAKNEVFACACNGVFSVTRKAAANELVRRGYEEVTVERLRELGFKPPPRPDVLDWNVRHDKRYIFLQ